MEPGSPRRPRVLIVGGPDVDRRIDLMRHLAGRFELAAAGSDPDLRAAFRRDGFAYHHYPLARGVDPLADARSTIRLFRLFRRLRPDIVHTFDTKPSVWGRLAARRADVPIVIGTIPGLGSTFARSGARASLTRSAHRVLLRAACGAADLTILQNSDDQRDLVDSSIVAGSRTTVVPGSGVRTDVFDPARVTPEERRTARAALGAGTDTVVVAMVCRVMRSKGVLDFAAAAALVRHAGASARFVLVGPLDRESPDRLSPGEIETVSRAVSWLGERRDVRTLLAASDVCALPTYYREGIPRSLLEAASMGLPLVATRMPGCTEVVVDGVNGFLVEPRLPDALAAALLRLIADPALRRRYGAASRARAVRRFDLSIVADQIADRYARLIAERRA